MEWSFWSTRWMVSNTVYQRNIAGDGLPYQRRRSCSTSTIATQSTSLGLCEREEGISHGWS